LLPWLWPTLPKVPVREERCAQREDGKYRHRSPKGYRQKSKKSR